MRQEKLINLSYVARAEPTLAFTWLARPPTTWQTFQKLSNSRLLQFLSQHYRRDLNVSEWAFQVESFKIIVTNKKYQEGNHSLIYCWWLGLSQPKTNRLIIHIQLVTLQKTLNLRRFFSKERESCQGRTLQSQINTYIYHQQQVNKESWEVLMTKESSCDFWPKSFATSRALWNHMQTNVGKRLNCSECKKLFSQ